MCVGGGEGGEEGGCTDTGGELNKETEGEVTKGNKDRGVN